MRTVPNELECERCETVDAESVLRCFGSEVCSLRGSTSVALRLAPIVGFALFATTDRFADTPLAAVARPFSSALFAGGFLSPSLDSWLVAVSCRFLRAPLTWVVIPRPLGVEAPCFVRWIPMALRSDTSEALRGRAAPSGDGTVGRLLDFEGDSCVLCRWGAESALLDGVELPGAASFRAVDAADLVEGTLVFALAMAVALEVGFVAFT